MSECRICYVKAGDPDHSGHMNSLRSLERWDRRFESHSRHAWLCLYVRLFCVCVVLCVGSGLVTGYHSTICVKNKRGYETEEEARAQQRAVEPLMNE
jgi:hypothetical protein